MTELREAGFGKDGAQTVIAAAWFWVKWGIRNGVVGFVRARRVFPKTGQV